MDRDVYDPREEREQRREGSRRVHGMQQTPTSDVNEVTRKVHVYAAIVGYISEIQPALISLHLQKIYL